MTKIWYCEELYPPILGRWLPWLQQQTPTLPTQTPIPHPPETTPHPETKPHIRLCYHNAERFLDCHHRHPQSSIQDEQQYTQIHSSFTVVSPVSAKRPELNIQSLTVSKTVWEKEKVETVWVKLLGKQGREGEKNHENERNRQLVGHDGRRRHEEDTCRGLVVSEYIRGTFYFVSFTVYVKKCIKFHLIDWR